MVAAWRAFWVGRRRPQCHAKLGDTSNALRCLVAIPPKSRSLKTQLLLGWLYKGSGLKRDAMNAYKAALKLNPLALEAVMALAQLGGKGESGGAAAWTVCWAGADPLGIIVVVVVVQM